MSSLSKTKPWDFGPGFLKKLNPKNLAEDKELISICVASGCGAANRANIFIFFLNLVIGVNLHNNIINRMNS